MPEPPEGASRIQDAQRTRVVVDAIAQAGFTARMAFSLAAGLAAQARKAGDDDAKQVAQKAHEAAERAKNADMSLDMAFVREQIDPAESLRDAGHTLARAAEAYQAAADVHEHLEPHDAEP